MEICTVWQTDDSAVARDVETLWNERAAVFPRDRPERLKELVAVAYDENRKTIGACTARAIEYKVLRARVFHLRPVIAPGAQHDETLLRLLSATKDALQPWAEARSGERLKGILVMFDSDAYDALYSEPVLCRPDFNLVLTGYTDTGHQIRMLWFDNARLEKQA